MKFTVLRDKINNEHLTLKTGLQNFSQLWYVVYLRRFSPAWHIILKNCSAKTILRITLACEDIIDLVDCCIPMLWWQDPAWATTAALPGWLMVFCRVTGNHAHAHKSRIRRLSGIVCLSEKPWCIRFQSISQFLIWDKRTFCWIFCIFGR